MTRNVKKGWLNSGASKCSQKHTFGRRTYYNFLAILDLNIYRKLTNANLALNVSVSQSNRIQASPQGHLSRTPQARDPTRLMWNMCQNVNAKILEHASSILESSTDAQSVNTFRGSPLLSGAKCGVCAQWGKNPPFNPLCSAQTYVRGLQNASRGSRMLGACFATLCCLLYTSPSPRD